MQQCDLLKGDRERECVKLLHQERPPSVLLFTHPLTTLGDGSSFTHKSTQHRVDTCGENQHAFRMLLQQRFHAKISPDLLKTIVVTVVRSRHTEIFSCTDSVAAPLAGVIFTRHMTKQIKL